MSFARNVSIDTVPSMFYTDTTTATTSSILYDNTGTALTNVVPGVVSNNKIYTHLYCYTARGEQLISTAPINTDTPIGTVIYSVYGINTPSSTSELILTNKGTITSKSGNFLYLNNSLTSLIELNKTSNTTFYAEISGSPHSVSATFSYGDVSEFDTYLPLETTSTKSFMVNLAKEPGKEQYTSNITNGYFYYYGPSGGYAGKLFTGIGAHEYLLMYYTKYMQISYGNTHYLGELINCTATEESSGQYYKITITDPLLPSSLTIFDTTYCLTGDTLITMSDGSTKRLDEIEIGDKVLCVNTDTLELDEDEVIFTDKDQIKEHDNYDLWTFSGGYKVKTVRRHRFYNIEDNCCVYMDRWKIGDHGLNQKGEMIELLSHENIQETVRHYKITTKNYHNYFANDMLTGSRLTKNFDYRGLKLEK